MRAARWWFTHMLCNGGVTVVLFVPEYDDGHLDFRLFSHSLARPVARSHSHAKSESLVNQRCRRRARASYLQRRHRTIGNEVRVRGLSVMFSRDNRGVEFITHFARCSQNNDATPTTRTRWPLASPSSPPPIPLYFELIMPQLEP